jgi:transposase
MEARSRKPYPTDVTDEEWAFVAPYLALIREDAPQRQHDLREVFNGLRYIVKTGAQWRWMPHDLPPWPVVYQQTQRWLAAGCFEAILDDLRAILRLAAGRPPEPSAVILDSQTLQSTPDSGAHAGYDGAKRKRGSKVHVAVDTLGYLLALYATPADAQDRAQVAALAAQVQAVTGDHVVLAFADQGYTGQQAAPGCRSPRHPPASGQTARSQARLCAAAQALDRGAFVCLEDALPSLGQGLRATAEHAGRPPLPRLHVA